MARRYGVGFWGYVTKTDTCWVWNGGLDNHGYGAYRMPGKGRVKAHRVAYQQMVGPVPEGLELDHLCRNPACVRPEHLEPVTHAENVRRAMRSHCPHGHPFDEANTLYRPNGHRRCRQCCRESNRRSARRKKEVS